jgi:hypothetical protein
MTTTPIPTGPTGPVSAGPNKLMIALISVGAILVVAIVVIAFLVGQQTGGNGSINAGDVTSQPSTPPSATPGAEATDEPTTDGGNSDGGSSSNGGGGSSSDKTVQFTSFNYNAQVACDPTGNDEKPSPSISWSSKNAVHVYWTPNSNDATADNGYEVGPSGNQDDMTISKGPGERYEFPCNHRETFDTTITLVGANGQTVSKHVTFTDINWNSGGDDDED